MTKNIGFRLRKFRNWFNRSYWAVRLLRLSKSEGTETAPGLVLIQIDGLSFNHFRRGLRENHLPFLRTLQKKENYRPLPHYSGMPSNTPAVQGELFYGVKGCVPAFSFVDKPTGETFVMFNPKCAREIETRIAKGAEPLLKEGSSYCNIFAGGGEASHFCAAGGGYERLFQIFNPSTWFLIIVFHFNIFFRTFALLLVEFAIGIYDFFRAVLAGKKATFEFVFILTRAVICVLLRELVVMGAKIDIARGLPVIHLNLLGYDEQAHHRGPSSRFAHWSLRGIDDAVSRVWKEARRAERRDYDIWIFSDHGQEDAIPYSHENGRSIESAIAAIFGDLPETGPKETRARFSHEKRVEHAGAKVTAVGMGPLVHIYPPREMSPEETERVIGELLTEAKVAVVLVPKEAGKVEARTTDGIWMLPDQAAEILGKDHPFLEEAGRDLAALCHHPSAGKLVISGWRHGRKLVTFAGEHGCHAGFGPEETHGFALLPSDAPLQLNGKTYLRPLDLRETALRHLERLPGREAPARSGEVKTLRVLTYNVHGCEGMDGKTMPDRIARVIARQGADVVCLQEIDVGRPRSGGIDQAERIAERLEMSFHFHAALTRSGEKYGNAILSRYPLKVIRMGGLPRLKARRIFEPRGALWVEVDVDGIRVNVINTHLSLWPAERLLQTGALLGPDWTGNTACEAPVILCGDFNANPGSGVCKLLGTRFRDAQQVLESHKPRGTWFAGLPFSRIDHFFVSPEVEVMKIEVPATELERTSSDHLPLLVEFQMDPNRTLKNIRGELQQAAVRVPEEEGRDAVL